MVLPPSFHRRSAREADVALISGLACARFFFTEDGQPLQPVAARSTAANRAAVDAKLAWRCCRRRVQMRERTEYSLPRMYRAQARCSGGLHAEQYAAS